MASSQVSLSVNNIPIETDYFVQDFIEHTISGMLASLQGTGEIQNLKLSITGEVVTINLNKATVPINPFVTKIIRSTIIGMVSPLKGVGEVNTLDIDFEE